MQCGNCGFVNNQKFSFCANCSAPLVRPAVAVVPPPPMRPAPAVVPPPPVRPARARNNNRKALWITIIVFATLLVVFTLLGIRPHADLRIPVVVPTTETITSTETPGVSPIPTPTQVEEKWSGTFIEADASKTSVELDIVTATPPFEGTWSNGKGHVSVRGQLTTWGELLSNVQKDLSSVNHDNNEVVVTWSGQGNATGSIWPNGLYYCLPSGDTHMQCIAYHDSSPPLNFDLDLQGSSSKLF